MTDWQRAKWAFAFRSDFYLFLPPASLLLVSLSLSLSLTMTSFLGVRGDKQTFFPAVTPYTVRIYEIRAELPGLVCPGGWWPNNMAFKPPPLPRNTRHCHDDSVAHSPFTAWPRDSQKIDEIQVHCCY
jgi:hypothetical protein